MAESLLNKLIACRDRIARIRERLPADAVDPVRLVREVPTGLAALERFLDQVTPTVGEVTGEA